MTPPQNWNELIDKSVSRNEVKRIDLNETWFLNKYSLLPSETREDDLSPILLDKTRNAEKNETKILSFHLSNEIKAIHFVDVDALDLRRS